MPDFFLVQLLLRRRNFVARFDPKFSFDFGRQCRKFSKNVKFFATPPTLRSRADMEVPMVMPENFCQKWAPKFFAIQVSDFGFKFLQNYARRRRICFGYRRVLQNLLHNLYTVRCDYCEQSCRVRRCGTEAEIFAVNVKQWKILGFWKIN